MTVAGLFNQFISGATFGMVLFLVALGFMFMVMVPVLITRPQGLIGK